MPGDQITVRAKASLSIVSMFLHAHRHSCKAIIEKDLASSLVGGIAATSGGGSRGYSLMCIEEAGMTLPREQAWSVAVLWWGTVREGSSGAAWVGTTCWSGRL